MQNIIQKPSPNFNDRSDVGVSLIILHYTGMKTAVEALARLTDEAAQVSSHYTVDEDGSIYQHVDEKYRAWHAGQSFWRGDTDINSISIGIEIVNPGHEFGYRSFLNAQIKAVETLCNKITDHYVIDAVLAHSDISPDRKQDPGELFPWKYLAQKGVGVWPDVSDDEMIKAADIDVFQALQDLGYNIENPQNTLIAFQRHFVPEAFVFRTQGNVCGLTKGRLYNLLVNSLMYA